MKLLTNEFLKKYQQERPPMTNLGEFVYIRTYSRWRDELKRREKWNETIERTIEYIFDREIRFRRKNNLSVNMKALRKEAERLYDNMFYLRQFASGRTMWVGGTEVGELFPMANYNCSFTVINDFKDFCEMFYLLMIGSGVGFRTLPSDIEKVPRYRTGVKLVLKEYRPVKKELRKEFSEIINEEKDVVTILVGDSKEGWIGALDFYFKILTSEHYSNIKEIRVNFDNVRPKGEPLKRFGGYASGHESLKIMFEKIDKVMNRAGGKLKPIDALDIGNIIAENVVSGGVRRSSEVNLASVDDMDIEKAKSNLFVQDENGEWIMNEEISHRTLSNNSIFYERKPTRKQLHENFLNLRQTGERGFINAEALRKRRPNAEGVNPCVEIILGNKGLCNLTTVNVYSFVINNVLNRTALKEAFRLSARIGIRMTLIDLELEEWDKRQKEDRLIGSSMTGWFDMVDATDMSIDEQRKLLRELKTIVREEANRFADELGINRPLLTTTIKPEGTLSQLPTVSNGIHRAHSPYFIRRVRISANDPLVNVLKELEYPLHPENGQTWENASTLVVEFPVKSPVKKTKYDVTAIEQLETYKMFMEEYVEHNASITVTVREHEWEEVEEWIWDNWDSFVGVSFLSLDENVYPLAPYEAITEEEYNERVKNMKLFDASLLTKYENGEEDLDIGSDSCEAGVCPIR